MAYTGDQKRAYDLAWRKKRRDEWIKSKGGSCAVCGSTDRLEIDHVNPKLKTMEPGMIWSRRQEIRDAELANCQVLCYDHHLEKTNAEKVPPHGTHSRYTSPLYRCRCTACKAAHASLAREWRDSGRKW